MARSSVKPRRVAGVEQSEPPARVVVELRIFSATNVKHAGGYASTLRPLAPGDTLTTNTKGLE